MAQVAMGMLTEFSLRQEIDAIKGMGIPPFQKAKLYMRVAKVLKNRNESLKKVLGQSELSGDRRTYAGIQRLEQHLHEFHEDVLDLAYESLHSN